MYYPLGSAKQNSVGMPFLQKCLLKILNMPRFPCLVEKGVVQESKVTFPSYFIGKSSKGVCHLAQTTQLNTSQCWEQQQKDRKVATPLLRDPNKFVACPRSSIESNDGKTGNIAHQRNYMGRCCTSHRSSVFRERDMKARAIQENPEWCTKNTRLNSSTQIMSRLIIVCILILWWLWKFSLTLGPLRRQFVSVERSSLLTKGMRGPLMRQLVALPLESLSHNEMICQPGFLFGIEGDEV